jgi:tetratricopeptide (TPR) repeat protein/ubiquinone/menaquinone biosynthesis C-methylase UbiE
MELTLDEALQKAVEAHKAGKTQEADRLYTAILQAQPKHPEANHNIGILAVGAGKIQESLLFFKTALEASPSIGQFWLSYIDSLIQLDQIVDAQTVLDQAKSKGAIGEAFEQLEQRLKELNGTRVEAGPHIEGQNQVRPNVLDSLRLDQAIRLAKKKAKEESSWDANRIYDDILARFPKNKKALDGIKSLSGGFIGKVSMVKEPPQDQLQLLIKLYQQGQLQQALDNAKQLLSKFPNSKTIHNIQGAVNAKLGQFDAAIDSYKKAIQIKPDYAEAYVNMGNTLKEKGDLGAAIESYKQAIKIKPDFAGAYYNMGNALSDEGNSDAAIDCFKQAININPDYAVAYLTMGLALKDKGALDAAIDSYKQALRINPDHAETYLNMGVALRVKDDLDAAIDSYKQALRIKPDYAEVYNNMGIALKWKGDLGAAILSYQRALKIKPDYAEAYYNMSIALRGVVFTEPKSGLMQIILSLLDQRTTCRPNEIALTAISLLKLDPTLEELLEKHSLGTLKQTLQETILTLAELPLLLKLMSVCPIADLELERILVDIRSALLSSVDEISISPAILRFQSALALQCFTNEYIYNQTDKETELLEVLKNAIEKTLSTGLQPSPKSILCLASYKALHEYEWCELLAVNTDIEEVFIRQIRESKEESRLKTNIPILQEITNKVSSKVKEQYEASPYPRWVNLGLFLLPITTAQLVKEFNLRIFDNAENDRPAPNILIAGCGTGQQPIETASRFKDCNVLAIDLSLSSLAYAKRKTKELGLQNIDFMQADILGLGQLDKKFDIIESAGVLHHMDDPMAGWKVLTNCLKSGGLMKIGLYSELARQHIVRMREEIHQSNIGSSDDAMKLFRTDVVNSNKAHHERIIPSVDFYSLSTLRDLLFHVQEHRFTIPHIKDCLSDLGLKFCGFESDKIVKNFKLTNTGKDDPYDLDKWDLYEQANPHCFMGMYQFWCQKVT